jgi:hypothetical protein
VKREDSANLFVFVVKDQYLKDHVNHERLSEEEGRPVVKLVRQSGQGLIDAADASFVVPRQPRPIPIGFRLA